MTHTDSIACRLCGASRKVKPSVRARRLKCKTCGHAIFLSGRRDLGAVEPNEVGEASLRPLLAVTVVALFVVGVALACV